MSLAWTGHFASLTTTFLASLFDYVSPDVDSASIVVVPAGGRDGRGGLQFTAGTDANDFAYGQYVQQVIPAANTQTFGLAFNWTTQGALGGRLLTLVDGGEDVFGETTQVGINVMSDGTLQAVRANVQGTGIILRGIDQGADSQTTLLGTSTDALTASQADYLEVQVFHHSSAGSITANFYVNHVLTGTWSLTNVNTAVSGRNQSTSFCYGGFASTDPGITVRHHEDLQGTISDVYVLNNLTNPSDARDPVTFIGDRASVVKVQTDNTTSTWTPDPVQANYLNVNEIPPDSGTTENTNATLAAIDSGAMQTSDAAPATEVYLADSAFIKNDSSPTCVSAAAAEFEALVYMESVAGSCQTGNNDTSACTLSNAQTRRAQTVCTIGSNGESVTFKPNVNPTGDGFDGFWVALSPLDAPPLVWNRAADLAGEFMQLTLDGNGQNIAVAPGNATYVLPFYQPWAGYAYSTTPADGLETTGDYIEFSISGEGASFDVGFIDHTYNLVLDPYSPVVAAIHFRCDIPGTPFFFCGENFTYSTETTHAYSDGDVFQLKRTATTIEIRQNNVLVETVTPAVMPANLYPYMLAGTWGFQAGSYSIPPAIYGAVQQVGTPTCIVTSFRYNCVQGYNDRNYDTEVGQWGIGFTDFVGNNTAQIIDGAPHIGFDFFPTFDYDENVSLTFVLTGGNVVLQIRNALSVNSDGSPNFDTIDANNADYTYTRPFSQTTDFQWQPNLPLIQKWYRTGLPVWPFEYLQYDFINNTTHAMSANAPLRLMVMVAGDSDYALPYKAGVNTVSFTFNNTGAMSYAGVMQQDGNTRVGTNAVVAEDYRYKQSFLASTSTDAAITVADYNESSHGYERSE